jgi:hypothetical protein
MSLEVVDNKGRIILKVNDKGEMATARYVDLEQGYKDYIIQMFRDMTDKDIDKLKKFLDYEEDTDEFCS